MPRKLKAAAAYRSRQRAWAGEDSSSAASTMSADEVAWQLYLLRAEAGLTQRELAKLVGTTASVICRLEDSEYEQHSLAMLRRIATVLGRRVEVRFVSTDNLER